ncbi:MAG: helix-turn-helix transcriptional regulator [Paludibacteraceae bacterium]|nr:helix-turn-helix transcriptional regulator [Paludibacteraceae bacterium]
MKDRIKKIRKDVHKTQQEFADSIGLSRNFIAQIETGAKENFSDRTIRDICRIYGVNETWLRTGNGDPYLKVESTTELLSRIEEEDDPFIIDVLRAYMNLNENGKKVLRDMCDDLRRMQNEREQT